MRTGRENFYSVRPEPVEGNERQRKPHMHMQKLLILSLIITTPILGMQLAKTSSSMKKKFVRTILDKSPELDIMRQKWECPHSLQDVVDISQGKIVIKEKIARGKRYGTCHNYAFTTLMGIAGKAPSLLNIRGGCEDYYGANYIDVLEFFKFVKNDDSDPMQPGDIIIYVKDYKGLNITHTGIVRSNDCIESTWGTIPAVFEHPIWHVPAGFGNYFMCGRLIMSESEFLAAVQKKSQQKWTRKKYDVLARYAQQRFVDSIKEYGKHIHPLEIDRLFHILTCLDNRMDIHLNVPDENGVTPLMLADEIGCEHLKKLFAEYAAHNE